MLVFSKCAKVPKKKLLQVAGPNCYCSVKAYDYDSKGEHFYNVT